MRKFLIIFVLLLPVVSVGAELSNTPSCIACRSLLGHVEEDCPPLDRADSVCAEEEYFAAMRAALGKVELYYYELAADMASDTYKRAIYDLYSLAALPADAICLEMEWCCKSCTDCETEDWSSVVTGYEKRIVATCACDSGRCIKTHEYRCAAGYYGSSTNGTSGCASCKTDTSNNSATSVAGSTAITSCYIPSGTSMTDDVGTCKFVDDCYYSN